MPAAYLHRVTMTATPTISASLNRINAARARLSEAQSSAQQMTDALAFLARKRLLASNTLSRAEDLDERAAWDRANVWLAKTIASIEGTSDALHTLDVDRIRALASIVGGGVEGERRDLRTTPVYSCGLEYLAPSEVAREMALLEERTNAALKGGLPAPLVAARVYICLVTIHPFENANGRVARLAADAVLLGAGYLPLSFASPIASHVAQMSAVRTDEPPPPARDAERSIVLVLDAIESSYTTVSSRL